SGATPSGSPLVLLPVTSRKFAMLMPARSAPVGASSDLASGMAFSLAGERVDQRFEPLDVQIAAGLPRQGEPGRQGGAGTGVAEGGESLAADPVVEHRRPDLGAQPVEQQRIVERLRRLGREARGGLGGG